MISNQIVSEFQFSASRSGGKGGQHVNTTASKVELKFHIPASYFLTGEQKALLLKKLKNKVDAEGYLRLYESGSRSQFSNKEKLVKKTIALLEASLRQPKKRKPTKMSASAKAKRRKSKERRSDLKKLRSRRGDP
jgi:ribosome-associated protein